MVNGDSGGVYTKNRVIEREKEEKEEKINNIDRGVLFLKKFPSWPYLSQLLNPPLPRLLVLDALSTLRLLSSLYRNLIQLSSFADFFTIFIN